EMDRQVLRQAERADAAHRMARHSLDLLGLEHASLAEGGPELAVVDARVATRDQQDDPAISEPEGQRLGDPAGFDAVGLRRQRDGCGTDGQLDDRDVETAGGEELADGLQAHGSFGNRKRVRVATEDSRTAKADRRDGVSFADGTPASHDPLRDHGAGRDRWLLPRLAGGARGT